MAYKSIKKGKGKRKGGNKSNRRTYEQRGGVNMLLVMLTIGMLATLNIIYQLPNTTNLGRIIKDNGPGPFYLGTEDSNDEVKQVEDSNYEVKQVLNVAQTASYLRKRVTTDYPLIKHPVVVTEEYLKTIIRQKLDGVVDEKALINEVLEKLPFNSVIRDGAYTLGDRFYVIDQDTLNGMIQKLKVKVPDNVFTMPLLPL